MLKELSMRTANFPLLFLSKIKMGDRISINRRRKEINLSIQSRG